MTAEDGRSTDGTRTEHGQNVRTAFEERSKNVRRKFEERRLLLVIGMNLIPRPLAIGMRFIPMDGGCLPHWDEALDESTGIIEAVYFAPYLYGGRSPPL